MSAVTSQLKAMTAVLSSQEASIGSLKSSEARLSCQVTEQRGYIEELQAKLMAALREVGRRPMRDHRHCDWYLRNVSCSRGQNVLIAFLDLPVSAVQGPAMSDATKRAGWHSPT